MAELIPEGNLLQTSYYFKNETKEEIETKITNRVILLNGQPTSETYIIKEHDEIIHTVHRHEPPVSHCNIDIIYSDENIIVIDKPCSIPVHASGRYRFNSLLYILAKEHNLNNLYLIHRLDRLTSGVLLLARNKEVASIYGENIKDGKIHKHYLAKVKGKFPDGIVDCDKAITQVSPKIGYNEVREDGKPCRTLFIRLSHNTITDTSIVYCYPVTGRTHQIRVHLYSLGHQIENDPLYKEKKPVKDKIATLEDDSNEYFDSTCKDCVHPFLDPEEDDLVLYLHAYCYESMQGQFVTKLPKWTVNSPTEEPSIIKNIEDAKLMANKVLCT